MKCAHDNAEHMMPGGSVVDNRDILLWPECEQLRCLDCGAWLSLGPAVIRDEYRTKIELLIAEHIADICLLWEPKDQDERIEEMLEQTLAFDALMSMTVREVKERYGVELEQA